MRSGARYWRRIVLSLCVAAALWASRSSTPAPTVSWAAGPPALATSATTPPAAAAASASKRQTREEADEALARLMANRKPVRAATARGQTTGEAPPFTVVPRQDRIRNFPCTKCHDNKFVDSRVRELRDEHTNLTFEHGGGRFWCYDACHKGTDIDSLVSIRGSRIPYDESYKLCGQCHYQRLDWFFGGHGKRQGAWEDQGKIPATADELKVEDRSQIGRWGGERAILNCTECHNPHSPSIKPFEPSPPPNVRSGLSRQPLPRAPIPKIWERLGDEKGKH
jgi:hypothetical protein